jgi:hypothetical protein
MSSRMELNFEQVKSHSALNMQQTTNHSAANCIIFCPELSRDVARIWRHCDESLSVNSSIHTRAAYRNWTWPNNRAIRDATVLEHLKEADRSLHILLLLHGYVYRKHQVNPCDSYSGLLSSWLPIRSANGKIADSILNESVYTYLECCFSFLFSLNLRLKPQDCNTTDKMTKNTQSYIVVSAGFLVSLCQKSV